MNPLGLQIGALALLSAFLLWKFWQRHPMPGCERAPNPPLTGKSFDASQINRQIEGLRVRYSEISQQRRSMTESHREFAEKIRHSLRRLAFFDDREHESHGEQHSSKR